MADRKLRDKRPGWYVAGWVKYAIICWVGVFLFIWGLLVTGGF